MRRIVTGVCALAVLLGTQDASAASAGPAALGEGGSTFWTGDYVGSAQVRDPSQCGTAGPCFSYPLVVTASGAHVLRVAIDSEDESNDWELQLIDPKGTVVADDESYQEAGLGERNDVELFAHDPAQGTWTVRVVPRDVEKGSFSARAALDWVAPAPGCTVPILIGRTLGKAKTLLARAGCRTGAINRPSHGSAALLRVRHQKPAPGVIATDPVRIRLNVRTPIHKAAKGKGAAHSRSTPAVTDILPNIAPDPPWHLTFDQPTPQTGPVESGSLTADAGVHQPTATVGGEPVIACLPEETAEQGAQRCLRFTSGVASLGPGHFEVYGAAPVPVAVNGGPLMQVIQRSDGTTRAVQAGSFSFHQVHLHYHVLALAQFPLYKVVDGDHMVPAGQGLKEGFCLGNIKLYNWKRFDAEPVDPNTVDNCEPSADPNGIVQLAPDSWRFYEGIATGWEDIYTWATSGQYVDFGADADDTYVLQMVVNPQGHFFETTRDDDTAYTEFQVVGNDVRILERGRGTSPWDPHKVVLDSDYTRQ